MANPWSNPALVYDLFRDSITSWVNHRVPKMGAALAYYTAFSLAPLISLIVSVVSFFMERSEAAKGMVAEISDLVGSDGGKVVNEILTHATSSVDLSWGAVKSFIILWISASGAFGELQDSLNVIWEVPRQHHPWMSLLKGRLLSLSMVFVLGFFMITSLLVSAFVTGLTDRWGTTASKTFLELANTVISLVVISFLFAAVFRMLPSVKLTWTDVLPGACFSAFLFVVGKFFLGWYISHSSFATSYGAASAFVIILFWVFYSAQILYFGAELTRSYTRRFGSHRLEIAPVGQIPG